MTLVEEKQDEQMASSHVERAELGPKEVSLKQQRTIVEDDEWRATERSLVRKLDLTLVPMVWLLYFFNYLDRNNIAYVP